MQFLIVILAFVFLVTHLGVQSSVPAKKMQIRSLAFAFLLTIGVFVQFFFFVRPPSIDYWKTGWGGTIRYLNEHLKATGRPYQLPTP